MSKKSKQQRWKKQKPATITRSNFKDGTLTIVGGTNKAGKRYARNLTAFLENHPNNESNVRSGQ